MANPQLGYGKQTEASIDTVNQWMRSQPWWSAIAGNGGKLSDTQRRAILKQAQANGVVVDEGDMEVDPAGNFNPKGHKLRNTLVVAGLAGATIATMGAAGAFGGAAAAGGGASAAGSGAAAAGAGTAAASTAAAGAGIGGGVAAGGASAAGGGLLAGAGRFLTTQAGASLAGTLANTFTNIYGMNQQAGAAHESAMAQRDAAQKAEQFAREEAEHGYHNDELNRHANYDMYAYRGNGARTLGDSIGFHLPELPAYVPSEDPRYTGGAPAASGAASGPDPAAFIANYQKTHDPKEGPTGVLNAMKQAGFNVAPYMYGDKQSGNEISLNGEKYKVISGENGPTPGWYQAGMNDSAPGAMYPRALGSGVAVPRLSDTIQSSLPYYRTLAAYGRG
jgi:hypothetical protein